MSVVIGSSLRDEHIHSVLIKHLNAEALHVVLVDPEIEKLRALLETEIRTERLNRLVRSAKVKFGEPDSWTRLRSKLLDAVAHARQFATAAMTGACECGLAYAPDYPPDVRVHRGVQRCVGSRCEILAPNE